jgi:hypothetical protein
MLYVRYIHFTIAKPIHKRQIHPVIREDVSKRLATRVQLQIIMSGRDPQGAWSQDEVIGSKPPVAK